MQPTLISTSEDYVRHLAARRRALGVTGHDASTPPDIPPCVEEELSSVGLGLALVEIPISDRASCDPSRHAKVAPGPSGLAAGTAFGASQMASTKPRFVTVREFRDRSTLSKSTVYAMMASGDLARPVRLSAKRVGWPADYIDGWLAARANGGAA